ncbi:hypothetical protein B0H14DRAFT_3154692 [Mycena olivaceomarginata]|nr:hypothetical protein B0H14DRAFT_3154692 [Mycena olivaceomarginata]
MAVLKASAGSGKLQDLSQSNDCPRSIAILLSRTIVLIFKPSARYFENQARGLPVYRCVGVKISNSEAVQDFSAEIVSVTSLAYIFPIRNGLSYLLPLSSVQVNSPLLRRHRDAHHDDPLAGNVRSTQLQVFQFRVTNHMRMRGDKRVQPPWRRSWNCSGLFSSFECSPDTSILTHPSQRSLWTNSSIPPTLHLLLNISPSTGTASLDLFQSHVSGPPRRLFPSANWKCVVASNAAHLVRVESWQCVVASNAAHLTLMLHAATGAVAKLRKHEGEALMGAEDVV